MAVSIAMQMNASLVSAESGDTPTKLKGMYAGVFVGSAQADNRIVDVTGFANWKGQPKLKGMAGLSDRQSQRLVVGGLTTTHREKVQYQ